MKAVVPAAGEGTRLRPLTDDTPKALVEVGDRPLVEHVLNALLDLDVSELVLVVGYRMVQLIDRYGDDYRGVPITYVHQRDQLGLAHALVLAEPHVEDDFLLMLGDNVFRANLEAVVERQRAADTDAVVLVEQVPWDEASRYGVCRLDDGELVELVEKPDDPPSNLVLTGFYAFSPAIFHACHLVRPSTRGEYELSDAIDVLLRSGRTVEPVRMDGWRVDVGYPADRQRAEQHLAAGSPREPVNQ
jgi:glucose-1-phosphate thymidylyltransferase